MERDEGGVRADRAGLLSLCVVGDGSVCKREWIPLPQKKPYKQTKNMKQVKAYGTQAVNAPLVPLTIHRRELRPNDIAFDILYCGICHSDLHTIRGDFGEPLFPLVPGHEILGRVTALGADVRGFEVGELVGVGCIVGSCGQCDACEHGLEQFCDEGVTFSFNGRDRISGGQTFGGFSRSYVCEDKYVLHMPAFDDLPMAAPLLCAGITVYSPLRHWQAGPGKHVGILGIGGLGHLAVRIAKAMGAEVTVFTTSPSKVEDAHRLGADHAVLSSDSEAMKDLRGRLDLILDTVSAGHDVNGYLGLLRHDGSMVVVGLPAEPLQVAAYSIVRGRRSLSGSNIGGIAETQEMLNFCHEHGIVAEGEVLPISRVNEALDCLERGDVRYRFVLLMEGL